MDGSSNKDEGILMTIYGWQLAHQINLLSTNTVVSVKDLFLFVCICGC